MVKCVFLALTGQVTLDPVTISDPLDLNGFTAAPARQLRNTFCLNGSAGLKD